MKKIGIVAIIVMVFTILTAAFTAFACGPPGENTQTQKMMIAAEIPTPGLMTAVNTTSTRTIDIVAGALPTFAPPTTMGIAISTLISNSVLSATNQVIYADSAYGNQYQTPARVRANPTKLLSNPTPLTLAAGTALYVLRI